MIIKSQDGDVVIIDGMVIYVDRFDATVKVKTPDGAKYLGEYNTRKEAIEALDELAIRAQQRSQTFKFPKEKGEK